jgi:site-specific recombinase XerD
MANELVLRAPSEAVAVPALIEQAGGNARFAYDEFFGATIVNPHTRRAYSRTVDRFLAWCEERGYLLERITPGIAGDYINGLETSAPSKNQALAALRHFFDALV